MTEQLVKQRSQEWFEARKGKITGSRVGAALRMNPFMSRNQLMDELVAELSGEPAAFTGNDATRWGEKYEAVALRSFERRTQQHVAAEGFIVHPRYSFIGYSPDGIIQSVKLSGSGVPVERNDVALLEIKCPYSQHIPDILPDHYRAQVQLGMEVLGLNRCEFVYWTPAHTDIRTVSRDRDWWEWALPQLEAFNEELIERQ